MSTALAKLDLFSLIRYAKRLGFTVVAKRGNKYSIEKKLPNRHEIIVRGSVSKALDFLVLLTKIRRLEVRLLSVIWFHCKGYEQENRNAVLPASSFREHKLECPNR